MTKFTEKTLSRKALVILVRTNSVAKALLVGAEEENERMAYEIKIQLKHSAHPHYVISKEGQRRCWHSSDQAISFLRGVGIHCINIQLPVTEGTDDE